MTAAPSERGGVVVFMVSRGEYSDYGIEGVFSTKELAEDYIRKVAEWVAAWDKESDPYDKEARYCYRSNPQIEEVRLDSFDRGPSRFTVPNEGGGR